MIPFSILYLSQGKSKQIIRDLFYYEMFYNFFLKIDEFFDVIYKLNYNRFDKISF